MFPQTLTTERLRLERLAAETVDVRADHELCSRNAPDIDAVTRYLPWEPHDTVAETREYLDALDERYVDAHGGQYEGVVRNRTVRPDGDPVDQHRFSITREQYAAATVK